MLTMQSGECTKWQTSIFTHKADISSGYFSVLIFVKTNKKIYFSTQFFFWTSTLHMLVAAQPLWPISRNNDHQQWLVVQRNTAQARSPQISQASNRLVTSWQTSKRIPLKCSIQAQPAWYSLSGGSY